MSMVCHEFRTPLAVIDGNAQGIIKRRETISPDKLMGRLGKVRVSVRRLTELMESVLSASKLEAGSIAMNPAPCNLASMIDEVAANYREVNPTYDIAVDTADLPESFVADVKLIRQVVSNLLSNAVKYSPDGAYVSIDARTNDDGGVAIAVRDEGVGIPEDELKKLFQRFFRASTSTGIAGTGIGLHMVQALVDMHGGRIDVASDVGVGTTFTVCLPPRDHVVAPDCDDIVDAA
ncbi:MAG: HAMP domain-containing sensor histidine kinase [Pseudomonadota bacterium]